MLITLVIITWNVILVTIIACKSSLQNLVDDADGRIIVLTFGVREGALKWLDDTKCPYPMLLDTERKVCL